MFVNGRREGEGTIRFASGEVVSGTWVGGALQDGLREADVERAVTLGAFIGQVPHTVPVPLVSI